MRNLLSSKIYYEFLVRTENLENYLIPSRNPQTLNPAAKHIQTESIGVVLDDTIGVCLMQRADEILQQLPLGIADF